MTRLWNITIYVLLSGALFACSPQSSDKASQRSAANPNVKTPGTTNNQTGIDPATGAAIGGGNESSATSTQNDDVPTPKIRPKVSAYEIDDKKFSLVQLTVGLQTFMTSETPVISYKIPEMADYVEILRCKSDMSGLSGLQDLEMSDMSEADKAQDYRSKDYFVTSEADHNCELITDGHSQPDFFDSFAPSGSYRYLVRSCVSPKRLTHQEDLSARNCSRRVGISSELADFTNNRKQKEKEALKLTAAYGAKIDATTNAMRHLAGTANIVLDECEELNRQRLITKKIREAWVTIFAAVLEVGTELLTIPGGNPAEWLKHYTFRRKGSGTFESFMDLTQLLGALQGYMLADTFKKLTGSSHDMVRTCATYKRLLDEYGILEKNLANFGFKYAYYFSIADLAQKGQLIADGEAVQLPEVPNMREFQDQPLPDVTLPDQGGDSGGNGTQTQ